MNRIYLLFLFLMCVGAISHTAKAQLTAGDIAFVQYNADGDETFKFLALVDIPMGTEIHFTDNGWKADNSFRTGENTNTYTAPSNITCGTIVTVTPASKGLSGSGDQLIAYTGTAASPTFLTAINAEGAGVWQSDATNSNTSALPTGLTNGTNAVAINEIDNAKYNGAVLSGTRAQLLAAINNKNNWSGHNSTVQDFTSTFSVTDCGNAFVVGFDTTSSSGDEGTTIQIPVTLANATSFPITLSVTASDLTSEAGDYVLSTPALSFANNGTQNISVTLNEDIDLDNETFKLTLTETSSTGVSIAPSEHTVTIIDNDTAPETVANVTATCTTNNAITLSWTNPTVANYDRIVVLARESTSAVTTTFVANNNDAATLPSADSNFSTATKVEPSSEAQGRLIYQGVGETVTMTGLTAGSTYNFRIYTYRGETNTVWSSSSVTKEEVAALKNVMATASATSETSVKANWALPNSACFDEILVVVNEASGITFAPTGDGSAYTANSVYTAADQVVYKGTETNVEVTGLTTGTEYFFEIFVRKGTEWSAGTEVSAIPSQVLNVGDLVIVGFDNKIVASGGDDKISIATLVDLQPGTRFQLANMVYETNGTNPVPANVRTDRWYACSSNNPVSLASWDITYSATAPVLAKGSVICITVPSSNSNPPIPSANFTVNGAASTHFASSRSAGSTSGVNFSTSSPDVVWLMQGNWTNETTHYSFDGKVLGGIQDGAEWYQVNETAPASNSATNERRSRIHPDIECFYIQGRTSTGEFFAYHSGIDKNTEYSQGDILRNLLDFTNNWTKGTTPTGVDNLDSGACSNYTVGGMAIAGKWNNNSEDDDWFNCANWDNLQVPTKDTDVVIDDANTPSSEPDNESKISLNSQFAPRFGNIATCRNLTIKSGEEVRLENEADQLHIYGNLVIESGGKLTTDQNTAGANSDIDGSIYIYGDWANHSNSSDSFTAAKGTVYFVGDDTQIYMANRGVEKFYNLVINKPFGSLEPVGLLAPTELEVENNLNFVKGIINIGNNPLSVQFNKMATATGASNESHVDGIVTKVLDQNEVQVFEFPTGDNGTYAPIKIETKANHNGHDFSARYFNKPYSVLNSFASQADPLVKVSSVEYWELRNVNSPSIDVPNDDLKVTLNWGNHSQVEIPNEILVGHYKDGQWRYEGNTTTGNNGSGTASAGSVTSAYVGSFSPFTIASAASSAFLPLDLIDFTASKVGHTVALNWEVANDKAEAKYCIERSIDGINFVEINCQIALRDVAKANYKYFDLNPQQGVNYYRIKHADTDGLATYSNVVEIKFEQSSDYVVYPNPVKNNELFTIEGREINTVDIYNSAGQVVSNYKLNGENKVTLPTKQFAKGVYVIIINGTETQKLTVQ